MKQERSDNTRVRKYKSFRSAGYKRPSLNEYNQYGPSLQELMQAEVFPNNSAEFRPDLRSDYERSEQQKEAAEKHRQYFKAKKTEEGSKNLDRFFKFITPSYHLGIKNPIAAAIVDNTIYSIGSLSKIGLKGVNKAAQSAANAYLKRYAEKQMSKPYVTMARNTQPNPRNQQTIDNLLDVEEFITTM